MSKLPRGLWLTNISFKNKQTKKPLNSILLSLELSRNKVVTITVWSLLQTKTLPGYSNQNVASQGVVCPCPRPDCATSSVRTGREVHSNVSSYSSLLLLLLAVMNHIPQRVSGAVGDVCYSVAKTVHSRNLTHGCLGVKTPEELSPTFPCIPPPASPPPVSPALDQKLSSMSHKASRKLVQQRVFSENKISLPEIVYSRK